MTAGNQAGSITYEKTGRWSLNVEGLLTIVNGLMAVDLPGQRRSTSDHWSPVKEVVGESTDRIGMSDWIAVTLLDSANGLEILWTGAIYRNVPLFAFTMTLRNVGKQDVLIESLVPLYAMGDRGAVVLPTIGRSRDWILLHQSKWMADVEKTWSPLDARQLTWAYHSSALCHAPSRSGIALGIGEASNTVTRMGAGLRGPGFDLQVSGDMSVNRHGVPFRLKKDAQFRMNRVLILGGRHINDALESYAENVAAYINLHLRHRPYTGIFCAYGQDALDRPNFAQFPLTYQRVSDLIDVLDKHVAPYGLTYIKTQFGGLSSGPGDMVFARRDWHKEPIYPPAGTGGELARIIRDQGFTPDTFNMIKHHPDGVRAMSDLVHAHGYRHALVCRPFLNVESGPPEWDDFVADIFRMAVQEWGYDYLMFDFVSADFENDHDDTRTMSQAIRDRFQRIREAVGAEIFIEACMVMPGPVLGIADGFRPAYDWRAGMEPELVSQFTSRFYYHSRLFQLDLEFFHPSITPFTWEGQGPDKGRRFFGSIERVKTWVSFSGICGYSFLTGGVIEQVSAERWRLFTRAMPVYGRAGRPVDWPAVERSRIWVLSAETAGRPHHAIGLFNWGTEAQEKVELDLAECGLEVTKRYVIFDFWAGKLLGLYGSYYETTLPPGGCQVLFVHEVSPDPIVIGTDRHVTGAIGIRNFGYDVHASEIVGTSEGPAGSCIEHFIYVPSGQGPSHCEGAACEVSQPCVLRVDVRLPEGEERSTSAQTWKITLAPDRVSI